jgi:hypothetical protein
MEKNVFLIAREEPFKHECKVLTTEEVMEGRSSAYEFIYFDKQETLEEAALNIIPDRSTAGWIDSFGATERIGFIKGAKWQKERSKEDIDIAYNKGFKDAMIKYRTI